MSCPRYTRGLLSSATPPQGPKPPAGAGAALTAGRDPHPHPPQRPCPARGGPAPPARRAPLQKLAGRGSSALTPHRGPPGCRAPQRPSRPPLPSPHTPPAPGTAGPCSGLTARGSRGPLAAGGGGGGPAGPVRPPERGRPATYAAPRLPPLPWPRGRAPPAVRLGSANKTIWRPPPLTRKQSASRR